MPLTGWRDGRATTAGRQERRYLLAACVLGVASFAAAVYCARDLSHVPPDGAHYGVIARNLLRGQGYTESLVPFHPGAYEAVRHVPELHGLLRPFALAPFVAVLGPTPLAIRIPGLVYTVLTGLVVFWWGRRLFGGPAALLACGLTLLNVNFLFYGLLGSDDVGFAFFFVATAATLDLALARGRDRDFLLAGILGALALLEKGEGFILPALYGLAAFRLADTEARRVARWLALLFAPFLAATGVYLLRNWVAYGSLQFRFGVFNVLWKVEGFEGWTQVFDRTPTYLEMLERVGWDRVMRVVRAQFRRFADLIVRVRPLVTGDPLSALTAPAFIPALALLGIPLHARRLPLTTGLLVVSVVTSAAFTCLLYTAEVRYYTMLIPLFALWVSGLAARGARSRARGAAGRAVRLASLGLAAGLAVLTVAGYGATLRVIASFPELHVCRPALAWIEQALRPDERVLTFDPWFVAWATDREAIMTPAGGAEAILLVARRYDAHWLLAQRTHSRPRTSGIVMTLEESVRGALVTKRFDDGTCRVYRLDWPAGG